MDNSIKFINEVTRKDYKKATYFNVYLKNKAVIVIVPLAIIICVAVIFMSIFNIYSIDKYLIYACITYMAIVAIFVISVEFTINGYIKTDKLIIGKKYTITVNTDEILAESENLESRSVYKWDTIHKCYKINTMFLIFLNTSQVLVIPKRHLDDEKQNLLSNLMKEKMGNKFIIRFDKIKIF